LDYEKPVSAAAQAKNSIGSFLPFSTASALNVGCCETALLPKLRAKRKCGACARNDVDDPLRKWNVHRSICLGMSPTEEDLMHTVFRHPTLSE
jgi:hypothetical protein